VQVQPELALTTSGLLLIVLLGVALIALNHVATNPYEGLGEYHDEAKSRSTDSEF
jgi:hypothetical protein